MISEHLEKVKSWCRTNKTEFFVPAVIFLVGMGGFGLGRLSVVWQAKEPLRIIDLTNSGAPEVALPKNQAGYTSAAASQANKSFPGQYVASRSGSAYHHPWCPGAQKIKEENKIWFSSKEEAQRQGYRPAANCPEL